MDNEHWVSIRTHPEGWVRHSMSDTFHRDVPVSIRTHPEGWVRPRTSIDLTAQGQKFQSAPTPKGG